MVKVANDIPHQLRVYLANSLPAQTNALVNACVEGSHLLTFPSAPNRSSGSKCGGLQTGVCRALPSLEGQAGLCQEEQS